MREAYYRDELVTIYHGEMMDVLRDFDAGELGGCITDPPYSSGGQFRSDRVNHSTNRKYSKRHEGLPDFSGDNRDQRGFLAWCSVWMAEVLRVCEPGAPFCTFSDWRQLPTMTDAVQCGGWNWQGLFVWDKIDGRPQKNRPRQSLEYVVYGVSGQVRNQEGEHFVCPAPIVRAKSPGAAERRHVTEKPIAVLEYFVPLLRPGTVLLDPFAGSGSTGEAAKGLGVPAILIEASEEYCETAAARCSQATMSALIAEARATHQEALELQEEEPEELQEVEA